MRSALAFLLALLPVIAIGNSGNAHRCDGSPGETNAKTSVGSCLGDTAWFPDDDMIARVKSGAAWDTAIHRHDSENIPGCIGGCRFNAPASQADYPVFLKLNDFKAVVNSFKAKRVAGKPSHLCQIGTVSWTSGSCQVVDATNCPPPHNRPLRRRNAAATPPPPPVEVVCTATYSEWAPAANTVARSNQMFVQRRTCTLMPSGCVGGEACGETTRGAWGTKGREQCTEPPLYTQWDPLPSVLPSQICVGAHVVQTRFCEGQPWGCAGGTHACEGEDVSYYSRPAKKQTRKIIGTGGANRRRPVTYNVVFNSHCPSGFYRNINSCRCVRFATPTPEPEEPETAAADGLRYGV